VRRAPLLVIAAATRARRRIVGTLRSHGYDVAEVTHASDAAAAASWVGAQLIVLDVAVPAVDGSEFRHAHAASPIIRSTPLIITTPDVGSATSTIADTAIAVLHKPFRDTDLLQAVEAICAPPKDALLWSRRGSIACAAHAPLEGSPRWITDGWTQVPAVRIHRTPYQCQLCVGGGPIQRRWAAPGAAIQPSIPAD
jgi:CheY-like chemotaxis protein